ncbi:unnamed protein product [Lampetra planeri]
MALLLRGLCAQRPRGCAIDATPLGRGADTSRVPSRGHEAGRVDGGQRRVLHCGGAGRAPLLGGGVRRGPGSSAAQTTAGVDHVKGRAEQEGLFASPGGRRKMGSWSEVRRAPVRRQRGLHAPGPWAALAERGVGPRGLGPRSRNAAQRGGHSVTLFLAHSLGSRPALAV